jgi:hypothetical protein
MKAEVPNPALNPNENHINTPDLSAVGADIRRHCQIKRRNHDNSPPIPRTTVSAALSWSTSAVAKVGEN